MAAYKRKHKKGTADTLAKSKLIARKAMIKVGKKVPVAKHRMRKGKKSDAKADLPELSNLAEESACE